MPEPTPLGEFLRARRAVLRPAGRDGSLRRVRGLRREEVAELASISPDYYVHLEQGVLVIHHARPGSESEAKLAELRRGDARD